MVTMKTSILAFVLAFCASGCWASGETTSDSQKMYSDFLAIQHALETHDDSAIEKICKQNDQSKYFCAYAEFLTGKLTARELISALPKGKEGYYKLFRYDEYVATQLQRNGLSNPYGSELTFVYIDQLCLLSYSFPKEALPALLTMYRYSEGYIGEYLQGALVKLMYYKRFEPEFTALEKDFPAEMKDLREAYKLEQAAKGRR